jgi:hypothetical protein
MQTKSTEVLGTSVCHCPSISCSRSCLSLSLSETLSLCIYSLPLCGIHGVHHAVHPCPPCHVCPSPYVVGVCLQASPGVGTPRRSGRLSSAATPSRTPAGRSPRGSVFQNPGLSASPVNPIPRGSIPSPRPLHATNVDLGNKTGAAYRPPPPECELCNARPGRHTISCASGCGKAICAQ